MAASLRAADASADGAAGGKPTLKANNAALPVSEAHVEPAVVIASPDDTDRCIGAREGHSNGLKVQPDAPAQLHLTPLSSSPTSYAASPTSKSRPRPDRPTSIVPVFWQHARQASRMSVVSLSSTVAITLTDNTEDGTEAANDVSPSSPSGLQSPLWARQVDIDSHVKIEGDIPGVGGYIVWLVKVQTLDGGGSIVLRKRYSEFEALRAQLAATFPRAGESLPGLPPKSVFYKFRPSFLDKRRIGLAYFLNCILLNPEFSGSPAVREFIFTTD